MYIYIYILSSTDRLPYSIRTLQCSECIYIYIYIYEYIYSDKCTYTDYMAINQTLW